MTPDELTEVKKAVSKQAAWIAIVVTLLTQAAIAVWKWRV